jgi:hypothetical protein
MTAPWTTLIAGIVGSHAYGLNGPDSDVDRLQFAAAPTEAFHGLHLPVGKAATREHKSPDITIHEAGKAVSLLLKSNPTVSEALWLDSYETITPIGRELVDLRERLLCAPLARNAYLGYATQQFQRLVNKGRFPDVPVSRIEKHARHLLRLVEQGTHLWTTGKIVVRVDAPERFFDFGRRVADDPNIAGPVMFRAEHTFATCSTPLPEHPDVEAAEAWLQRVRAEHYNRQETTA